MIALLIITAYFSYKTVQIVGRQKNIIEKQKEYIEKTKKIVMERKTIIEKQGKNISNIENVQEKNKTIIEDFKKLQLHLKKTRLLSDCAEEFYYKDRNRVSNSEEAFSIKSLPDKDQERLSRIAQTLIDLRKYSMNVKLTVRSYSLNDSHAKERLNAIKDFFMIKGFKDEFFGTTESIFDKSEINRLQKNKQKRFWVKLIPEF